MELDQHPDSNTNHNSDIELFIVREPAFHTEESDEAPEYRWNQKQKKKGMPSLPRPVR
jgi:hypothetical protein